MIGSQNQGVVTCSLLFINRYSKNCRRQKFYDYPTFPIRNFILFALSYLILFAIRYLVLHAHMIRIANIQ